MKGKEKMKPQKVKIKVRDWNAVNAQFRTGAGAMKDKRKEQSKKSCKQFKQTGEY